jgi:hypothetical protein
MEFEVPDRHRLSSLSAMIVSLRNSEPYNELPPSNRIYSATLSKQDHEKALYRCLNSSDVILAAVIFQVIIRYL